MSRTRVKYSKTGQSIQMKNQSSTFKPNPDTNYELCTDSTHPGPPYKSGGPLLIRKIKYSMNGSASVSASNHSHTTWYSGQFWVNPSTNLVPIPSEINLSGWGAKGFNRGLPVHDALNLGQAAIELRDFGGMVTSTHNFFSQFGGKAFSGKSAAFWADAHLNASFGWKPFLDDFYSMLNYQNRLGNRLAWLKKHNQKPIHRHFTLSQSSSERVVQSIDSSAPLQPVLSTVYYPGSSNDSFKGHRETREKISERIWFDGCFTYHIPKIRFMPGHDSQLKLRLLGLFPDLNLVYKVTPWSWLLDWFTSVGSVINNGSLIQKYSQVAKYAYVMRESKLIYDTYGYQFVVVGDSQKSPTTKQLVYATARSEYSVKQRAVANPYGFGITWDSLNPFQLSILLALGITRSHSGS